MNNFLTKHKYSAELPLKLVYLLFGFMTHFNLTRNQPIMTVIVDAVLIVAVFAGLMRVLNWKGYIKTNGIIFPLLFMISYTISAVLNFNYGYSDNLKYFIWIGCHFVFFYICDVRRSSDGYKKEFQIISDVFIAITAFLVSVSLIQFAVGYSEVIYRPGESAFIAGFVWGRLWGMFYDPNYGSVFAVISIVLSIYKLRKSKNKIVKVLMCLNVLIQVAYIAFSDSRTGIITIFAAAFVYSLFMLLKGNFNKIVRSTVCAVIAVAIAFACMYIPVIIKDATNEIVSVSQTEQPSAPGTSNKPIDDENDKPIIGRQQDLENDISNKRFSIWKSGVEIFSTKPIFGVSFFNLVEYSEKNLPETYLINNGSTKFNNMHNIFFNVLSGQGIVGTVIIIAFAVYFLVFFFRRLPKVPDEDYGYIITMFTVMTAAFASAMFVSDILYVNSPNSILFWLFAGYTVHYMSTEITVGKNQRKDI